MRLSLQMISLTGLPGAWIAAPHPRFPSNAVQSGTLDIDAASAGTPGAHAKTTVRTPKRRIDRSCHQGQAQMRRREVRPQELSR